MLRTVLRTLTLTTFAVVMSISASRADIDREESYGQDNYDQIKIDRYLDVEVWTNHSDGEFYEGDKIVISFRANRDAFVAIYSVDSRNRVNLLFPTSPNEDNFVIGGETYRLPGENHDFDLVVSGPDGVENIQVIASKERFPIPDWYPTSGLICDWDDRFEFMDNLNVRYFAGYPGQRFAFDRSSIYINEWEDTYFRPVYYPTYPNWTVTGNVYLDYPYGCTVYINGIYWGVTPLYIPRIYVGWHTITLYDRWGDCWEHDFHVGHYNTVVLDRAIIQPRPNYRSKYKEVQKIGYRDPIKNGYPTYNKKVVVVDGKKTELGKINVTKKTTVSYDPPASKKYVKGTTRVVKTDRGYETAGKSVSPSKRPSGMTKPAEAGKRSSDPGSKTGYSTSNKRTSGDKSSSGTYKRTSGSKVNNGTSTSKKSSGNSEKKSSGSKQKVEKSSQKKSSDTPSGSSVKKQSSPSKSSGDSKSSGGGKSSSSSKKSSSSNSKSSKSSGKSKR